MSDSSSSKNTNQLTNSKPSIQPSSQAPPQPPQRSLPTFGGPPQPPQPPQPSQLPLPPQPPQPPQHSIFGNVPQPPQPPQPSNINNRFVGIPQPPQPPTSGFSAIPQPPTSGFSAIPQPPTSHSGFSAIPQPPVSSQHQYGGFMGVPQPPASQNPSNPTFTESDSTTSLTTLPSHVHPSRVGNIQPPSNHTSSSFVSKSPSASSNGPPFTPHPHINPILEDISPWYSSKFLFWASPSRKDGISYEKEKELFKQGLDVLWECFRSVYTKAPPHMNPEDSNTYVRHKEPLSAKVLIAFVYYSIFFCRLSMKTYSPREVAIACLFVACKLFHSRPIELRCFLCAFLTHVEKKKPENSNLSSTSNVFILPGNFEQREGNEQLNNILSNTNKKQLDDLVQNNIASQSIMYLIKRILIIETIVYDVIEYRCEVTYDIFDEIYNVLMKIESFSWLNIELSTLETNHPLRGALVKIINEAIRIVEAIFRNSNMSVYLSKTHIACISIQAAARMLGLSQIIRRPPKSDGSPNNPWYHEIFGLHFKIGETYIEQACKYRKAIENKVTSKIVYDNSAFNTLLAKTVEFKKREISYNLTNNIGKEKTVPINSNPKEKTPSSTTISNPVKTENKNRTDKSSQKTEVPEVPTNVDFSSSGDSESEHTVPDTFTTAVDPRPRIKPVVQSNIVATSLTTSNIVTTVVEDSDLEEDNEQFGHIATTTPTPKPLLLATPTPMHDLQNDEDSESDSENDNKN